MMHRTNIELGQLGVFISSLPCVLQRKTSRIKLRKVNSTDFYRLILKEGRVVYQFIAIAGFFLKESA